ncbi:hypothetical protein [Chitinimonas sp. BJB300]|uniref:hypothetical protein n=1 Tax=Chitinimonas sp. BJB300 TaxID=1559339 RepID=UPI0011129FAE|nr:hypothetical protein [Chitinimonas sp. BJB300]TSJ87181.1 hypothetical protein FG002_015530 [Chitinimonas sp. BJB300]
MDFSALLKALNEASGFELFRLRVAIDRALEQPHWQVAIQRQLHIGQMIEFFDGQDNRLRTGRLVEMRRKQAVVELDEPTRVCWLIPYVSINVDGLDVSIREQPKRGLGRNEVAIGDMVGFRDRDHNEQVGRIVRLNDKTVTLRVDGHQWRVAYELLHRFIEARRTP